METFFYFFLYFLDDLSYVRRTRISDIYDESTVLIRNLRIADAISAHSRIHN